MTVAGNTSLGGDLDLGDSGKIKLGVEDDLQIYHDGSHSYIKDTGTGNLVLNGNEIWLKNAANSANMIGCVEAAMLNYSTTTMSDLLQPHTDRLLRGLRITGNHTDTGSQLNIWCDNSGHARSAVYDWFFYTGGNNARSNVPLFLQHTGYVGISGITAPVHLSM